MNVAPVLACRWLARDIGTVAGFLSAAECAAYVRLGERIGYEEGAGLDRCGHGDDQGRA